jgi:hypothetical protein
LSSIARRRRANPSPSCGPGAKPLKKVEKLFKKVLTNQTTCAIIHNVKRAQEPYKERD